MGEQTSFRPFVLSSIFLFLIGWGGLILIIFVFNVPPLVWARWGFYVLGMMGLTGTALPIVYFLHRRFPSDPPAESGVIVRQALWVGIYGATLAWLQLGGLVTIYIVLGLAGGLILAEFLIRLRERSRWKPPNPRSRISTHETHDQPS